MIINLTILLNGEQAYPILLPKYISVKRMREDKTRIVQNKIYEGCHMHGIDYISQDNVRKLAKEIVNLLYERAAASKAAEESSSKKEEEEQRQQQQQEQQPAIELTEDLIKEVSWDDITAILDTSIKKDKSAKLITFCGMLLAQTNRDQLNIGFQSESSSGKSYIPMELANYFPQDEIMKIASASPTAFYHKGGKWDDARKVLIVDLEHKIIIFMDMPGFQLMERLRPMLSHDDKELIYMITENKKQGGLRTKTVILRGFPSIVFASAKQNMDDQEKTRLIQLSPAVDQEKLHESLELSSLRNADPAEFARRMLENPARVWLINRISSIRQCTIREVVIPDHGRAVFDRFIAEHEHLKPRHQRDLPRIFAFIKSHALLNCHKRERLSEDTILANTKDIDAGFELYREIEMSSELGLSPYLYGIYTDVIKPLLEEDGMTQGVGRDKIIRRFYQVRHKPLSPQVLKQEILPQLEAVGLIQQAPDREDRRKMLVFDATKAGERDNETIF